jgi:DNA topoisomerase-1
VCRKCYIHPAVVESYMDGTLAELLESRVTAELSSDLHRLSREEAAVLGVLQQRLSREGRRRGRAA